MDVKRLKAILAEHNDTQDDLAKYLGVRFESINSKLNNHKHFKVSEIRKIKEKYKLSYDDVYEIFLADIE